MITPPRSSFTELPGWDLVSGGIADLQAGRETIAGLLVSSASQRLSGLGFVVPVPADTDVTGRLYALVEAEVGVGPAHSRYNALRRRLASFLRTADATTA